MHIVRIELENIKSHKSATFDFERGTTAITGANGAGKTTIIEAIAWALFGFLDYNKADFVSRGEKKGQVRITVETADQKQYTVVRDTGSGYYVFDPTIKTKICSGNDEVVGFLRRILQVEPGTDLKELFQTAIGVPQGTFTADFLLSRETRKRKFDKLLKVEEYRNSAEKLKITAKYTEGKRLEVWEKIVRAETQLETFETIVSEQKLLLTRESVVKTEFSDLQKKIETSKSAVTEFDILKKKIDETANQIIRLELQITDANRRKTEREQQVTESKNAFLKQNNVQADYKLFETASESLKTLQADAKQQVLLQSEIQKLESQAREKSIELKNLQEKLEISIAANLELKNLSTQIEQYQRLEIHLKETRDQLSIARNAKIQLDNLGKDLEKLRQDYLRNKASLDDFEKTKADFELQIIKLNVADKTVEAIEQSRTNLSSNLANLKATVEKDRQFEIQVENGLCPILSQKCLNLGDDENLSTYFKSAFSNNSHKINELSTEQTLLDKALNLTRESEKHLVKFENAKKLHEQTTENGKRLKEDENRLDKLAATVSVLEKDSNELEIQLIKLGNPVEREKILKTEAEKEQFLKRTTEEIKTKITLIEADKTKLSKDILLFEGFDEKLKLAENEVAKTQSAQRIFLELQGLAGLLKQRETDFEQSKIDVVKLEEELERSQKEKSENADKYREKDHLAERDSLDGFRRSEAVLETELRQIVETIKYRDSEIGRLKEIQAKLITEKSEESKLKKVIEATTFISDTLKKAAPEVAKMLLARISQEANLFFREMTGNAERTLSWKEDYEVSLEESGHERPFSTLSGGEQMSAALSVRLALLQELSDIRFAFFDEPTTNLDAERREKLALAINGISQKLRFSQIFVVSHDDTFESHTDYVISVK
jgi:DNA repair protein SbcC/Rad50